MKWNWNGIASHLLAAVVASTWTSGHILTVAAAEDSCPGGVNDAGQCINPDAYPDMDDEESSSDDGWLDDESSSDDEEESSSDDDDDAAYRANPHAHRDEDEDPMENRASCDEYLSMEGFKYSQETSSFYQEMGWGERFNLETHAMDVCMTLDDIVQICSSYRPHYHEPFVHFPAAYLKDLKRVAFIGGGDSMLLHEALKYPNVEMVLGLELDQKNVRESLRFFQTQPHFDDPRVQWWFGDAAKSLALLPREWFGTFDLIMVDLSETGMSISVNDDLDIFSALALLLKPEGIMVKNEDYFSQMSKYFDYSISVYMDGNPMLCDQDWAMGSNKVDFLQPKLEKGLVEEYGVKTLEYSPVDHYRMIIDYAHNDARKSGACDEYDNKAADEKKMQGAVDEKPSKPTEASGILLVAEAENVTRDLDLDGFLKTLKAMGLTPLESSLSIPAKGEGMTPSLFIFLEQGYVAAHSYHGHPSVGLEILLWSKLGKQNDVLLALLSELGVETSYSSYRVIHGGMQGHLNWEEEANMIGPVKKNVRDCDTDPNAVDSKESEVKLAAEVFDTVVTESLSLLTNKGGKTMAVICGARGVDDCATLNTLKNNPEVHNLVAIWACPGTHHPDNEQEEYENGKMTHVYVCSEGNISRSAKSEEGYSALIVDIAAPSRFVEQVGGVFCNDRIFKKRMNPYTRNQVMFISSLSNDAERNTFLRCTRRISRDLARGGILVMDKTAEIGIVVSANDVFVRQLVTLAEDIETKSGLSTEIDRMKSGPVPFQSDFDPLFHSADAYSQLDAMKLYTSQTPLASQSIYQLNIGNEGDINNLSRSNTKELLDYVIEKSDQFTKSDRAYHEVGDGSVAVALTSLGHIIVTWNGKSMFTVNILTVGESYGKQHVGTFEHMVLLEHDEIIGLMKGKLPASTGIGSREHMPRGANRVVNFKYDIISTPSCADHYELCDEFSRNGKCDKKKHESWMQQYCALSCETCDGMMKAMQ